MASTRKEARTCGKVRYAETDLGPIAEVAVLPGFTQARFSELAGLASGSANKAEALGKMLPEPEVIEADSPQD